MTNEAVVSTIFAAKNIASKLLRPEAMSLVMACQFPPALKDLTALWTFAMIFPVLHPSYKEAIANQSRYPL